MSQRSGLPASRIRFYESSGVLRTATRQHNGYRDYPEDALLTLRLITRAQRAGFTLDQIRTLVPSALQPLNVDGIKETLMAKIAEIEALLQHLSQTRDELLALVKMSKDKPGGMDCLDNARRVMREIGLEAP